MRVDYGREAYQLTHLTGNVRFYLKAVNPHLQLYMTPVNLDPGNPAMPISVPADEAARLQAAMGPYYTQGMPDDTKALEAAVLDYDEFLSQDSLAMEERRGHLRRELARFESGFLFFYVHSLDQVSHVLWRATDPSHPGYRAEFARHGQAIEHHYESMDELLGEAMTSMGDDGQIVVLSDHGFAPYERSFNINSWLLQEGYIELNEGVEPESASILRKRSILWEQTQAYGLGLNALYLNIRGREDPGAVEADQREALIAAITSRLLAVIDPRDGRQVVEKVYVVDKTAGSAAASSPDLLIGYARGYRSSGAAALGQIEAEVIQDNLSAWSGDHCMADHTVPGVLVTSMSLNTDLIPHLRDIAGNILEYYGMEVPDAMKGRSVWRN
jgi:predicted AlkP superfamily phosphohydrolase/phosphomutase